MPSQWPGKLIAHRAQTLYTAENTIIALKKLPKWVNAIEIDVRTTSDGIPILMHDSTVNRTTDGSGSVSSLTLAEIKAMAVDIQGGPTTVPTLEEMLDQVALQDRIETVLLDMSDSGTTNLEAMLAVVEVHSVFDRCIVMVRSSTESSNLRARNTDIRLGRFGATDANISSLVSEMTTYDGELILTQPEAYESNRTVVAIAQAGGLQGGSSVNNKQTTLFMARSDGADAILTDVSHGLRYFREESYS